MRTGYKEMLRNRLPYVVDLALKWCKAKDKWLDHVYKNFIGILLDDADRKKVTRTILGINKGKPRHFNFHQSILWEDFSMTKEEREYWTWVEGWVSWFRSTYGWIECKYKNLHTTEEYDEEVFIETLKRTYFANMAPEEQEKIAKYIVKSLQTYTK